MVKPEFYDEWERLRDRSGMSQQEMFDRLVRFLFTFDATTQSMILGQIPASKDLVQFIMHRLVANESARKHGAAPGHGVKPLKAASNKNQLPESERPK